MAFDIHESKDGPVKAECLVGVSGAVVVPPLDPAACLADLLGDGVEGGISRPRVEVAPHLRGHRHRRPVQRQGLLRNLVQVLPQRRQLGKRLRVVEVPRLTCCSSTTSAPSSTPTRPSSTARGPSTGSAASSRPWWALRPSPSCCTSGCGASRKS